MTDLLLGRSFTGSQALNIIIVIVEILAVTGFYASTGILTRYAIRQSAMNAKEASKLNLIFTLLFLVIGGAGLYVFRLSLLPLLGILIWCPLNYAILTYKKDTTKKGNLIAYLVDKYSEIAVYLIVGVFTTVVAWGVFALLSLVLDSQNGILLTINTILNWTAGVLVAYPMNRHWVFHSTNPNKLKEFFGFAASRVTTLIIEEVVMILCVNVIGINEYVSKYVIASIIVIILNYVFSKLLVFKKK